VRHVKKKKKRIVINPEKVMKGRLRGWASLFMGAQLGNLEWAHLLGTLRCG
jgi:hypothetical protein